MRIGVRAHGQRRRAGPGGAVPGGRRGVLLHRRGVERVGGLRLMPTLFTRIIEGEIPGTFVWRDDQCVAFLSINPLAPGHTLVVPIEEIDHWVDAPPELNAHLFDVAQIDRPGPAARLPGLRAGRGDRGRLRDPAPARARDPHVVDGPVQLRQRRQRHAGRAGGGGGGDPHRAARRRPHRGLRSSADWRLTAAGLSSSG